MEFFGPIPQPNLTEKILRRLRLKCIMETYIQIANLPKKERVDIEKEYESDKLYQNMETKYN